MARLVETARRGLGGGKQVWRSKRGKAKVSKVMREWKSGKLHSGSKKGPKVTSRKQAIAIALSEAKNATKE
jgi:hypothetical protein